MTADNVKRDTEASYLNQFKLGAACEMLGLPLENDFVYLKDGVVTSDDKTLQEVISFIDLFDLYKAVYLGKVIIGVRTEIEDEDYDPIWHETITMLTRAGMCFSSIQLCDAKKAPDNIRNLVDYMSLYLKYISLGVSISKPGSPCTSSLAEAFIELVGLLNGAIEGGNIEVARLLGDLMNRMGHSDEAKYWYGILDSMFGRADDRLKLGIANTLEALGEDKDLTESINLLKDLDIDEAMTALYDLYVENGDLVSARDVVSKAYKKFNEVENPRRIGTRFHNYSFEDFCTQYTVYMILATECIRDGHPETYKETIDLCDKLEDEYDGTRQDMSGYREVATGLGIDQETIEVILNGFVSVSRDFLKSKTKAIKNEQKINEQSTAD